MEKIKFSIVILNYNTGKEAIECIRSIERTDLSKVEVSYIIVDNCSTDNSCELLESEFKNNDNINILKLEKNYGFSKGNNIGYQYARKRYNPEFIGVINSDILFNQHDFFNKFLDIYNKNNFYILGPDIYAPKMKIHQNPYKLRTPTYEEIECELLKFQKKLEKENKLIDNSLINKAKLFLNKIRINNTNNYKNEQHNIVLYGAALFFSKKFIHIQDDCFYPETFLYGEEILLSILSKEKGYENIYTPDLQVIHLAGVSTNKTHGKNSTKNGNIFRNKQFILSRKKIMERMKEIKGINE